MRFVLLTIQRTASEKRFLLSILSVKEHVSQRPLAGSGQESRPTTEDSLHSPSNPRHPAPPTRTAAQRPPALPLPASAQTTALPRHEAAPLCPPRYAFSHPSSKVTSPPKLFLWLFGTMVNILAKCLVNIPKLNSFKCTPTYHIKVKKSNARPFV